MSVLYYSQDTSEVATHWQTTIGTVSTEKPMQVVSSLKELSLNLSAYRQDHDVVVTYIQSQADLTKLLDMQPLVNDLFLIIICDKADDRLFNRCRLAYPRLLVKDDDSAEVIAAIISKRLSN